jgi:hypothetical protein
MMVGAVTRIFEPGHKFDFAVILEGLQGKRKSTFIRPRPPLVRRTRRRLPRPKQMIELMQGAWIMEIPELSGFSRADVRAIKAFISRQKDRARLAYARRAGEFPRQCIFIGSTNDREYLKDDTGGRRFWPMLCTRRRDRHRPPGTANVDQLWAEAVAFSTARCAPPSPRHAAAISDRSRSRENRQAAAGIAPRREQRRRDRGTHHRVAVVAHYQWLDRRRYGRQRPAAPAHRDLPDRGLDRVPQERPAGVQPGGCSVARPRDAVGAQLGSVLGRQRAQALPDPRPAALLFAGWRRGVSGAELSDDMTS